MSITGSGTNHIHVVIPRDLPPVPPHSSAHEHDEVPLTPGHSLPPFPCDREHALARARTDPHISRPTRLAPVRGHTHPLGIDAHGTSGHNHGLFRVQIPPAVPMPMSMCGAVMSPLTSLAPSSPSAPRVNARIARRSSFFPVPNADGTHEHEHEDEDEDEEHVAFPARVPSMSVPAPQFTSPFADHGVVLEHGAMSVPEPFGFPHPEAEEPSTAELESSFHRNATSGRRASKA